MFLNSAPVVGAFFILHFAGKFVILLRKIKGRFFKLSRIDQSTVDTSFVPERHPGARARWAIQIATTDSFSRRWYSGLSKRFGRYTVEHSFMRLAQIWCDENDEPLKDPKTGRFYPAICVRGELNPGPVDPETGQWKTENDPHTIESVFSPYLPRKLIDSFNKHRFGVTADQVKKRPIVVFSWYGEGVEPLHADRFESPVMVGNQDSVEALWTVYQQRALEMNKKALSYDLVHRNCHTAVAALNRMDSNAMRKFSRGRPLLWGVNSGTAIHLSEGEASVIRTLEEIQEENRTLLNALWTDRSSRFCSVSRPVVEYDV
ncbi:MAG: hypothetical protein H6860_06430 [Rhodospirillales bacterium]|nr:hypothetical protein [Alphaproteobacteria bacterium]MCB9982016.1 hypothetical protein [Rhodospirillales bacterium]